MAVLAAMEMDTINVDEVQKEIQNLKLHVKYQPDSVRPLTHEENLVQATTHLEYLLDNVGWIYRKRDLSHRRYHRTNDPNEQLEQL